MTTVAKLDAKGRLVGVETLSDGQSPGGKVVVNAQIDLPLDGSYWWDEDAQTFVALSQLAALVPADSPVALSHATFLALRALVREQPIPDEVREFVQWHEAAAEAGGDNPAKRDRAKAAVVAALRALVQGVPMPDEVRAYVDWYEAHEAPKAEAKTAQVKRLLQRPLRVSVK